MKKVVGLLNSPCNSLHIFYANLHDKLEICFGCGRFGKSCDLSRIFLVRVIERGILSFAATLLYVLFKGLKIYFGSYFVKSFF